MSCCLKNYAKKTIVLTPLTPLIPLTPELAKLEHLSIIYGTYSGNGALIS